MAKNIITLLTDKTTTGAGTAYQLPSTFGDIPASKFSFQAIGSVSTSTGSATIIIEVSNDGTNFKTLGTISLSLTTSETSDGFVVDAPWAFVRANVTVISGTDATVSVLMGI